LNENLYGNDNLLYYLLRLVHLSICPSSFWRLEVGFRQMYQIIYQVIKSM